jgi:hypothetical protein
VKRTHLVALVMSFLVSLAFGQGAGNARLAQYRPVLELARTVSILLELDAQNGLSVGKPQATHALELLRPLASKLDVAPDEANAVLRGLETNVLSKAQKSALEERRAELERIAHRRVSQARFGDGGGGAWTVFVWTVPGSPLMVAAINAGKAVNPFKLTPGEANLARLIESLEKR